MRLLKFLLKSWVTVICSVDEQREVTATCPPDLFNTFVLDITYGFSPLLFGVPYLRGIPPRGRYNSSVFFLYIDLSNDFTPDGFFIKYLRDYQMIIFICDNRLFLLSLPFYTRVDVSKLVESTFVV